MALPCGCTPDASGYGWCSECRRKLKEKIWAKMSEREKRYDRQFAPEQSRELSEAPDRAFDGAMAGCSCHINPPCSYCVSKGTDDE